MRIVSLLQVQEGRAVAADRHVVEVKKGQNQMASLTRDPLKMPSTYKLSHWQVSSLARVWSVLKVGSAMRSEATQHLSFRRRRKEQIQKSLLMTRQVMSRLFGICSFRVLSF